VVAAFVTVVLLGLALTPQDSGALPSGDWGLALLPGSCTVALTVLAVVLWRDAG
jgi:hypothetical protein